MSFEIKREAEEHGPRVHVPYLVLRELADMADPKTRQAFPSQQYLADMLCMKIRAVGKAIAVLKRDGFITVHKEARTGSGSGWRNVYTIANIALVAARLEGDGDPPDDPASAPDPGSGNDGNVVRLADRFPETFWEAYPSYPGKKDQVEAARAAYDSEIAKGETAAKIEADAKKFQVYCERRKVLPQHRKHFVTWLQDRRQVETPTDPATKRQESDRMKARRQREETRAAEQADLEQQERAARAESRRGSREAMLDLTKDFTDRAAAKQAATAPPVRLKGRLSIDSLSSARRRA